MRHSPLPRRWSVGDSNACGGLVFSHASSISFGTNTGTGSRLAFKSEELAEYAGKQFIDIYAQMIGLTPVTMGQESEKGGAE